MLPKRYHLIERKRNGKFCDEIDAKRRVKIFHCHGRFFFNIFVDEHFLSGGDQHDNWS
jgi:hypothetical protein